MCRRSGEKLFLKGARCFTPKCAEDKRPKPPGMAQGRRKRVSDRGFQLREKQKARYIYGPMEKQFQRTFEMAEKQSGIAGENLLVLLERRLDNVVYRLGFADSRAQARQLAALLPHRQKNAPAVSFTCCKGHAHRADAAQEDSQIKLSSKNWHDAIP